MSAPGRLWTFRLIALGVPLLFCLVLELGLRVFGYGEDLSLFIPAPDGMADAPYLMVNPKVSHRYFSPYAYAPEPGPERFLRHKPVNGYRIFVLGGSSAAGWPYPANVMFSHSLQQRLQDVFPEKRIEVVNTGIAAVGTYTLLDFMDEILARKPDALLVYAGHNEFYGALGAASSISMGRNRWLVVAYLKLLHFKTVQLVRDIIDGAMAWWRDDKPGRATLMGRVIGQSRIPYGGPTYRLGERQFRANLTAILEKARHAGVRVVLSEVISNIRDQKPFISLHRGDEPPADKVYGQARALEEEGRYGAARTAYYRAKDLDALRFRASEDFNDIIHRLGAIYHVPVVPMKSYFKHASPHGLIGDNLIIDHLHPNVRGYLLMSKAFFETLHRNRFIAARWPQHRIKPDGYYRRYWPVTDVDRALGRLRIMNLTAHWPFTSPSSPGLDFDDYHPENTAEALALAVIRGRISYISAHVQMAHHLRGQGDGEAAIREYLALNAALPDNPDLYLLTANALIDRHQYARALPLLESSLRLRRTAYAAKQAGQILLARRRFEKALELLRQANRMAPDDAQLLYELGRAYALTGQRPKAVRALQRLRRLSPDFPGIPSLQHLLGNSPQENR